MITDEELEKMHMLQLILADELKRICEKNNITYFMISGTLLGAVRHEGFVPWDDDMDFGILREEFEKFLVVCDEEIDKQVFFLQTDRNEKYYPHIYAKLCLQGTEYKGKFLNKKGRREGIFIDIFAMDTIPDNKRKKWVQHVLFGTSNALIKAKTGYVLENKTKSIRHGICRFIASFFTIKFLKRFRLRCMARYSDTKSKYVVASGGAYGLNRETLQRKWVENLREYVFEDRFYNGIADYDEYLTYFYGDYKTLPPEEDRKYHIKEIKEINFGIYSE